MAFIAPRELQRQTIGTRLPSLGGFIPGVADRKCEKGVVAGIVIAEAGAREMTKGTLELKGAALAGEDVRAESTLRREIHGRGVAWRNIAAAEYDTAVNGHVRRDGFTAGEIPLPDDGLETSAVYAALRRKDYVHGHEIHGPLEVSAGPS